MSRLSTIGRRSAPSRGGGIAGSAADVTARAGARRAHANGNGNGNGRPSAPAVTVVIPSRNEEENIAELVSRLNAVAPGLPLEIVFVDDSDDETPHAVRAAA